LGHFQLCDQGAWWFCSIVIFYAGIRKLIASDFTVLKIR
jgi:hypothetical protein